MLGEITPAVAPAPAARATRWPLAGSPQGAAAYAPLLTEGLPWADTQPPPPTGQRGRRPHHNAQNRLDRLSTYRRETRAFRDDVRGPGDHKLAARARRMSKGQQQVSGCFRPPAGAQVFWHMRGSLSTMKKQGQPVLTARKSVFTGQPVMPALPG